MTPSSLTIADLRKSLTPQLSGEFFRPHRGRVIFLIVAYLAALLHFACTSFYLSGDVPLAVCVVSFLLAANTGTFFFFFMHEVLHGGVFKNKALISFTSFLSGVPFLCSPYVWRVWHNHHHRHTAEKVDTDRPFHPDFDEGSGFRYWFHDFAKRLRYPRLQSYIVPWFVISGHHLLMLLQSWAGVGPLTMNKKRAVAESLAVYLLFFLPLVFLPWRLSLFGLYLPLLIAHLICNTYILTNHFDNPLNEVNCPLDNSTSVYLLPGFPFTHMGFGMHVEHHIYPHVTHNKLAEVRRLLRQQYPDHYRERPIISVMHAIFARQPGFGPIQEYVADSPR
ncbi:MAG: fatty acid desaturase [Pirellulales bacterium]|nr:fatty acid desaturase [Pirellulales bacterium]